MGGYPAAGVLHKPPGRQGKGGLVLYSDADVPVKRLGQGAGPVSYTHLDVYKRQVQNIRTAGRATQGVIVMRFKTEGDRVISMALADPEGQTPSAEE